MKKVGERTLKNQAGTDEKKNDNEHREKWWEEKIMINTVMKHKVTHH